MSEPSADYVLTTPSVLEEWKAKEYGSWEDHGCPEKGHIYPILTRYTTRIRWQDTEELALLVKSAEYHRNAWDPEEASWMNAMQRIYRRLHDAQIDSGGES